MPKQWQPSPSESDQQIKFVEYLRQNNIPHYAIPNGEKRDIRTAQRLKMQGVSKGIPDICITLAKGGYFGLYIEMKALENGRLSKEQKEWFEVLSANGYHRCVCHGYVEAINRVEEYIRMKDTKDYLTGILPF